VQAVPRRAGEGAGELRQQHPQQRLVEPEHAEDGGGAQRVGRLHQPVGQPHSAARLGEEVEVEVGESQPGRQAQPQEVEEAQVEEQVGVEEPQEEPQEEELLAVEEQFAAQDAEREVSGGGEGARWD
jgi:hypothetical protein